MPHFLINSFLVSRAGSSNECIVWEDIFDRRHEKVNVTYLCISAIVIIVFVAEQLLRGSWRSLRVAEFCAHRMISRASFFFLLFRSGLVLAFQLMFYSGLNCCQPVLRTIGLPSARWRARRALWVVARPIAFIGRGRERTTSSLRKLFCTSRVCACLD